ncbi:hypothetical protein PXH66_14145 [Synoicihabitans lomoniglobus]|uniref:Uncharacterized protein n=2 Tax=Synoicihabitans lomoniglobus TaxID=2909285 RepID=A0AAE9ZSR0_9BACT|nr:hypothetical protein PXH66_14145 [Opitutaceae bacterium LMO-M01]
MQIEARISKEWRRRMIFMGIMIWGSALWFASDGYLVWPAEAERYQTLVELTADQVPEGTKLTEKTPEVKRIWEAYAREHDLKTKVPKNRTAGDLAGQRGIAGFLTLIGLVFTTWFVLQHRRSVTVEGDVITGASGEKVGLDDIVEVDRRKWVDKGIAYGIYDANGKRRRLCLDDHKFIGCEAIILEAERRIKARTAATSPTDSAVADTPPDSSQT